ncbi:HNH homing endonuclease [Staphylococcus phage vB_StaM_PB50]|nr:HNH homing endonuclease [Staphylococcus phage vB_StaM_PB50]
MSQEKLNNVEEEWYDAKGYKGILKITKSGRVKRVADIVKDHKGRMHIVKECEYALFKNGNGTKYFTMNYKGKKYTVQVHSLLAKTFVKNPKPYEYDSIHFIDGNKENISIENLCWVPKSYFTFYHRYRYDKSLFEKLGKEMKYI